MSKKNKDAATPATGTKIRSAAGERLRKQTLAEIQARVDGKPYEGTAYRSDGKKVKVTVPRDGAKPKGGKATKEPRSSASATTATKSAARRLSALDAAAQVLAASNKPMRAKDLIDAMAAKGLWKSPGGKTPEATLYAAILREIQGKKGEARFKRVERGLFAATPTAKKGA